MCIPAQLPERIQQIMRESETTSGLSPLQAENTADTSTNLDNTSATGGSNFQTIRRREGDGSESESDHEHDKPPPADYQGTEEDEEEQKRKALAKLLAQKQKELINLIGNVPMNRRNEILEQEGSMRSISIDSRHWDLRYRRNQSRNHTRM